MMKRNGKRKMIKFRSEAEAILRKGRKRRKPIASKVIVRKVKGSLHLLELERGGQQNNRYKVYVECITYLCYNVMM